MKVSAWCVRENRLLDNELTAFNKAVLPHLDAAYNLARWLSRNDHDAEDVVQEASLRAFKYWKGFSGRDCRSWLLAIVRNTYYSWLQKQSIQPELTEDARFKTVEARWDNRAELNAIVEAWTRQRSKHEVMRLMGDAGVPCGACQDTGEVNPHLKAREMIVDVDYPTRGIYQTVGCPIKLSDSPVAVSRPPLLGEHTDELLESLCGVEPDEAKRLRQEGVV